MYICICIYMYIYIIYAYILLYKGENPSVWSICLSALAALITLLSCNVSFAYRRK